MEKYKIPCLDHGFVKLLNAAGPIRRPLQDFDADSTDPAKTARISFDKFEEERTREKDLKLVKYLIEHKHNTPIEMIEVWLEMKLPIFLSRQFVRHRTSTINEISARYSILPEEWYIPEIVGGKSTTGAKQGQEDNLSMTTQNSFKDGLNILCKEAYKFYLNSINCGVAPEHARLSLHLNHYTHWVWKQDLHNLFHFLTLRIDPHAQVEARIYAAAILELLKTVLPEITDMKFPKETSL